MSKVTVGVREIRFFANETDGCSIRFYLAATKYLRVSFDKTNASISLVDGTTETRWWIK